MTSASDPTAIARAGLDGPAAVRGSALKRTLFGTVRHVHRSMLLRELPRDVAIYFHELEPAQWPAFESAMTYFLERGYRCVSAEEFAAGGNGGKRLFVSFDDNFTDWHRALGLMDTLKIKATFYVNTRPFRDSCDPGEIASYFARIGYRGASAPLSRAEIRELADAGHAIGCHSHSHYRLTDLPRHQWDGEIAASKHMLEDLLGQPVRDFSYPYGMRRYFSRSLRAYCARQGFTTIATGRPGLQHARRDPIAIHRSAWNLALPVEDNVLNLRIDGRIFEAITGRSPVG